MAQAREVVPVMDVKTTPKRSKVGPTTKATATHGAKTRKGLGGLVRCQLHGRGHPRPDLRAPLDPPGRPPLRRDRLGVPDRRHRQRVRQDRLRAEGRRGPRRSGASSPPTSSSASTSAATSARPERETSVRQLIDRVVNTIAAWAETQHYFATDEDLQAFQAELTHLLVHQKMAFNSPVWFNVGIEAKPQCSACFINSVQDTWPRSWTSPRPRPCCSSSARAPASTSRPSAPAKEKMAGGGIASGPVSFMKGYDAFAGVVKSGGKTRRAAKMVILDADHPDVLEFIECKANEEQKAWALIEAGLRRELHRRGLRLGLLPERQPLGPRDRRLHAAPSSATASGRPARSPPASRSTRYKARDVFRKMAEAAWLCGDPGIQYDTTINDWHTCANTDRINASQPVLRVHVPQRHGLQPRLAQPHEVRRRGRRVRRRGLPVRGRVTITAQEILVDNASYPTPKIEENSHKFRPLGLGYANLGALLMQPRPGLRLRRGPRLRGRAHRDHARRGVPPVGRASPATTAARSTTTPTNREPFLRVIGKHRDAAYRHPDRRRPAADARGRDRRLGRGARARRAARLPQRQVTVLAPTGTIAFMMDCDTTGIEPDIALVKYKKLVGEGFLKIVNQTVPVALRKLGYDADEVDEILAYVNEHETIEGAPDLKPRAPAGLRLRVQAGQRRAVHPLHGPRPDDGRDPAVPLGRDQQDRQHARGRHGRGDREGLPRGLEARPQGDRDLPRRLEAQPAAVAPARRRTARPAPTPIDSRRRSRSCASSSRAAQVEAGTPPSTPAPGRADAAVTHKFDIAGHEGYITVGLYPDGQPGEIFLKMAKEGSTISGLMDTLRDDDLAWRSSTACRSRTSSTSSPTSGSSRRASPATRRSRSPSRSWTTSSAGSARASCRPRTRRSSASSTAPRSSTDVAGRASAPAHSRRSRTRASPPSPRLSRRRRRRRSSRRPPAAHVDRRRGQGDGGLGRHAGGPGVGRQGGAGGHRDQRRRQRSRDQRQRQADARRTARARSADHRWVAARRSPSRPRPTPPAAPTAARSWSATAAATSASTAGAPAAAAEPHSHLERSPGASPGLLRVCRRRLGPGVQAPPSTNVVAIGRPMPSRGLPPSRSVTSAPIWSPGS